MTCDKCKIVYRDATTRVSGMPCVEQYIELCELHAAAGVMLRVMKQLSELPRDFPTTYADCRYSEKLKPAWASLHAVIVQAHSILESVYPNPDRYTAGSYVITNQEENQP